MSDASRMKVVSPTAAQIEMDKRITGFLREISGEMSGVELLAITANIVGRLVALQDQRTMTPEMVVQLVKDNIRAGNEHQINELMSRTAGRE